MTANYKSRSPQRRSPVPSAMLAFEPPQHTDLQVSILTVGKHFIGSDKSCSIRLEVEGVQPRHAMILVGEQKTLIKALDAKTWVNDGPVTETVLRVGDRVSIGPITFKLRKLTQYELETFELEQAAEEPEPIVLPPMIEVPPIPAGLVTVASSAAVPDNITIMKSDVLSTTSHNLPHETTSVHTRAVDAQIEAIQRQLQEFQQLTDFPKSAPMPAHLLAEQQAIAVREQELKHLKADLISQSQQLIERGSRLDAREADLANRQHQLAAENDKLMKAAQAAQQALMQESIRQKTIWQEWDASYQRSSAELKHQFETIERHRETLRDEQQRLSKKQQELDQLQYEAEQIRREIAAEKVRMADDAALHQLQTAAFESERRQRLTQLNDRHAQIEQERGELNVAHQAYQTAKREFEQQKASFTATSAAVVELRAEHERQQSELKQRVADAECALSMQKVELESLSQQLQHQRDLLSREREQFVTAQRQFDLGQQSWTPEQSTEIQRLQREQLELSKLHDQNLAAETVLRSQKQELEVAHSQLEAERRLLANEREELAAAKAEFERQRQSQLQTLTHSVSVESASASPDEHADEQRRRELDQWQQDLEALQAQLEDTITYIRGEHKALEVARADLAKARLSPVMQAISARRESIESPKESNPTWRPSTDQVQDNYDVASTCSSPFEGDSSSGSFSAGSSYGTVDGPASIAFSRPADGVGSQDIHLFPERGAFEDYAISHGSESAQLFESQSAEVDFTMRQLRDLSPVGRLDDSSTQEDLVLGLEQDVSYITETEVARSLQESVEDTLSDINRQFGFVAESPERSHETTDSATEPALSAIEPPASEANAEASSATSDDPLLDLRAKLAQMFEMSDDNPSAANAAVETETVAADYDHSQTDVSDSSSEASVSVEHDEVVSHAEALAGSTASEETSSHQSSSEEAEEAGEPSDAEDAWTRRLRELSQFAGSRQAPPPPPVPVGKEGVNSEESSEASEEDEEFSVEAQLARLLGRPMKSEAEEPVPVPVPAMSTTNSLNVETPDLPKAEHVDHDRSHLTEAPKHRQDKDAIREEVQSFRAVAQLSARKALENHSWKNFKSQFYFSLTLAAVSAGATAWFGNQYLNGSDKLPWKAVCCLVAMALCALKVLGLYARLKANRAPKEAKPS